MGFDNECILNIQSLPGEYFCPVCRTLVYPNEALQSQCTHLYCKPCLAYIVTSTRACPYDGYLVTEADSKPLTESNTSLADTIGKVAVHCLYYRSGCQWQGGLSESITHCAECNFGTSAVICNRCGTQIMHRQVQEHGLTCPGMQPQAQQTESQAQDSKVQGQAVAPDQSSAASAAPALVAPTTASSAVPATTATAAPLAPSTTSGATAGQGQIQSNAVLYPQAPVQTPTPEQWYQQQYQQYYQQFPGYDPYQQYQQYAQYQQQVHPQYAQQMQQVVPQQVIQGQQQQPQYLMPQPQVQPQPQPQPQPQAQPLAQLQPHPQTQSHSHPQAQLQPQPQPHPQAQLQPHPQSQPQPQIQLRPQLPLQPQAQPPHQLQPQTQPQLQTLVPHPQTHGQVIQPHPQHQYPQSQIPPQIQAPVQQLQTAQQPHPHAHPQSHPPPHAQLGGQQPLQPQARPHHPQPQPQHMPPQQLPQMQHPQFHAPQQPHPQPHLIPQHQQPPHPQPQPFVQPHPQHPSAQAVSGHQSYPQPQPGQQLLPGVPQRPMQAPPQLNPQNQFPQQQTLQMRPPHTQLPMQVQQQSNAMPPQGSHVPMGSGQQQAHHLVLQGQQIHQHPGMQLHAHPQGTNAQHHSGQPLQMHPQQPVHAHGQQYMQQQAPVQPTQGMQPPYLQSPATSSKPTHSAVNQQSPNKSYASPALQSGSQPSTLLEEKTKQSESTDLKISKSEIDSKSDDNREEAREERKSQKDGTIDESAEQMHEKGLETNIKDEQTKEHVLKPPVKEDASEPSGKPGQGEGSDVHKLPDGARAVQPDIIDSQVQRTENVVRNMHAPSQHLLQPQNHLHGTQPGSNQERKLPGPPPHPPQVFGQAPMPNQMGPPLRNNPDSFPYQGAPSIPQESFQPPIGNMPHGPYSSEVPHPRLAGPGLPPSSGVAPGPMGHHQNYMPSPHGLGPTNFQGQPLGRPGMGGPPSGPGGSAFAMENQTGLSHPGAPGQHAPFGHSHPMPTNGISGIAPHGVPKERFGPAPEESFRPFPEQLKMHREEHFVPSTIDLKRFEEDMKRFPRPDHLDREGRNPFGLDSRPLPLSRSGGHADFGDRLRPLGHHEDLGRNHDLSRSSGGEYADSWPGKFGLGNQSHMNDFANRERHGFGDRSKAIPLNSAGFPRSPGSGSLGYFDGPGSLRKDIDGNLTGRHIDIAEPGYGSRRGFPGETKPFNLFSHPGGMDPFEFSRVRKPGSLGLCRICKIDCDTVEGLDLHSQTREHQKMAMNMVLSIKQENAKRHKLNSEGNAPFEESSRMRKPSFESHLTWT